MNAQSPILPALRIDAGQIQQVIAKANALLRNPDRGSLEYLAFLCAADVIIGNDALTSEIETAESDLGLGEGGEPECLACGGSSCDCDDNLDDRSAWGMTTFRTASGGFGVAA